MWKTGSRDKSTIKRRAKYKFYLTAVHTVHIFAPAPVCARARGKKDYKRVTVLYFETSAHGHHMVQHFRWLVGFVDPRAQGIDEKERIDVRGAVQKHRIVDSRSTVNRK